MGSGFRAPETPSKAAGPREPGQPRPGSPYGEQRAGAENGLRCSLDRGALGLWFAARGEFPFAECSCQKLVWGVPCDGASALSGRAGSGGMAGDSAQKAFARPTCFPTKENPWGVGFGRRDPQQSSRAQGARGSPAPLCPMERVGRGRKRLALLSGSDARWGCGLLLEECFPLQNAAARSSFWAEGATGPQRCAAELAQGAWLGTVRMRPSSP